jgi:hypothetical protein
VQLEQKELVIRRMEAELDSLRSQVRHGASHWEDMKIKLYKQVTVHS